jgi:hypothetical protein
MTNQEEQAVINLMDKNKNWLYYGLSMIVLSGGCIFGEPIMIYLSTILFFACFDIYGFGSLLTRNFKLFEPIETDFLEFKIIYRYMQFSVMFLLGLILILISIIFRLGYMLFLASAFTWWFGFCDYLFYKILKQDNMLSYKDMTWLSWTPYGIYLRLIKKPIDGKYLVLFSWLAMLISLMLIVWFEYL